MADDLIIKFFREDLTEAEEEALSQRLSSSVEEAQRFGQHAEASYRHYGLPEPQWRGGPPPDFYPKSGPKFGLWLSVVLLAGLSAWGVWKYWLSNENKLAASGPEPAVSGSLAHSPGKKAGNSVSPSDKGIIPDRLETETSQTAMKDIGDSNKTAPPVPSKNTLPAFHPSSGANLPALTPVNATTQPHHPHSNLEVLVKRAKAGEVTVRVLEPDGNQAVMLYEGLLQPGSWIFDWNGRLADGGRPPAGTYQIQVVSGAVTLSKPVVIRK